MRTIYRFLGSKKPLKLIAMLVVVIVIIYKLGLLDKLSSMVLEPIMKLIGQSTSKIASAVK